MPKSVMRRASITIWSGISQRSRHRRCRLWSRHLLSANVIELPIVKREPCRKRAHLLAHRCNGGLVGDVVEHFRDKRSHFAHLGFTESACGDGGRAQPDAAWVERRVGVERNGGPVGGGGPAGRRLLGFLAPAALGK